MSANPEAFREGGLQFTLSIPTPSSLAWLQCIPWVTHAKPQPFRSPPLGGPRRRNHHALICWSLCVTLLVKRLAPFRTRFVHNLKRPPPQQTMESGLARSDFVGWGDGSPHQAPQWVQRCKSNVFSPSHPSVMVPQKSRSQSLTDGNEMFN